METNDKKLNFLADEFERLGQRCGHDDLPEPARNSLMLMRQIIAESESPADVALAVSAGLGFCMVAAKKPNNLLKSVITTALQVQNMVDKMREDEDAHEKRKTDA